jgi:kanamycin kinase
MLAGPPPREIAVPGAVLRYARGRVVRAVWQNEVGGLTFRVGEGAERSFVKWFPPGQASGMQREAARMRWARPYTPVPEVLEAGDDGDHGAWLATRAVNGDNAVSPQWKADPATAVRAIGEGLRALHDALPVGTCPFSWSAEDRIADAHRRADQGEIDPARWHPIHRPLGVEPAIAVIADVPPVDQLVVCHGDACAPNTLLTEDGRWCAHVDLGALGVADRWADLAVATWSLEWNYGPEWEPQLLDAYGVEPDPERTRYYRLLWDLGP